MPGTRILSADAIARPAESGPHEPHGTPNREPSCVSHRERRASPPDADRHERHREPSPIDRDAHERDGCAPPLKTRIPSMGTRTLFADGAAPPAEGCRIEPHGPPHKEPSCVSPRERRAPPAEGEVHRRHSRASPFDASPHERDSCASHSETCILSLETLILPAGTRIPSANATAHPVEGRPASVKRNGSSRALVRPSSTDASVSTECGRP